MSDPDTHSNKTIAEQLGIQPDMRAWIGGHQIQAKRIIAPYLTNTTKPPTGPIDVALIAPENPEEAVYFAEKIKLRLTPSATIWIVFSVEKNQGKTIEAITPALQQIGFHKKKKVIVSDLFAANGYTA